MKAIRERIKEEEIEVFLDYRDVETLPEVVKRSETLDEFIEELYDSFQEAIDQERESFRLTLIQEGYSEDEADLGYHEVSVFLDIPHIIENKVRVDVLFNFYNDLNTDMSSDSFGWLRWLSKSQGYRYSDFKKVLTGKKEKVENEAPLQKFPQSVLEEIYENGHYMTALTALNKTSIKNYYAIKEKNIARLKFPKETTLGLFNPWVGGGSLFGIILEKDFTVNIRNILSIGVEDELELGYSPNQVYGLVKSVWSGEIKV